MAFCNHCGNQLAEGIKFCPKCGTAVAPAPATPQPEPPAPQPVDATPQPEASAPQVDAPAQEAPQPEAAQQVLSNLEKQFASAMENAVDCTAEFDPKDIEANKVMALLSYLGILVLVPIFAARESKFARFHANQGLVLCIVAFVYTVAVNIVSGVLAVVSLSLFSLCSLLNVVSLAFFAMAVMGILNALNGKAKELPVIGRYKLLK